MAAIDKIYCSYRKDFVEFYEWCEMFEEERYKDTQKYLTDYFYITPQQWDGKDKNVRERPITNTPFVIDKWLWMHCPIRFIRDRLVEWGYSDRPSKRQLFYIEKNFDREKYREEKTIQKLKEFIKEQEEYKEECYPCFEPKLYTLAIKALEAINNGECRYKYVNKLNTWQTLIF